MSEEKLYSVKEILALCHVTRKQLLYYEQKCLITAVRNQEGGYLPEEKIALKDAIYCYTMGSAISCHMEDKVGTLEVGKYADIIVLDTNILTCTP